MNANMTTLSTQTISEIASRSLGAVRIFERLGIDYCCGGKRPVEDACRELGMDSAAILAELDAAIAGRPADETDWSEASLRDLIRHIVEKHHEYLKLELPRISQRLQKVMRVYGQQDQATLAYLPQLFAGLQSEMELHMHKEEAILFPFIERLESSVSGGGSAPQGPFGSIANPIAMMEHEHDSAGTALKSMRENTNGFAVPDYACVTYRSLLDGLRELEQDLHIHIHLENNILFPRAIALESANQ
ncbi:MAG: iron-sulfur cluster repair di-iron protein [Bryobacterales bacterium]|nr:iron-sulfur cluster repair di-iron protein [Bryobacterales bacterium]